MSELDPWLEGYLSYVRDVRRMAPRTVIDIRCTLKKVCAAMVGRAESALAKDVSHLRGMLDYAWKSGRSDRNVLDGFSLNDSVARSAPRSLTLEEAQRLIVACPRKSPEDRRRRIVVLLLYGCGLRTFELCSLDVSDVNVERQEIFIKKGKGERQRTIPVPAAVWTELLAYLTERGGKRGPLLRTIVRGSRISSKDVTEIVREAVLRAAIDGPVTPRTLRHSFGTHLMDAGVDLAVIASLMGHRTPNETGIYLHALPGKKETAVDALFENEGEES
jgi:integrase/recombinase XerD